MKVESRGGSIMMSYTQIGNVRVSRLISGGNPISGFSHAGRERTRRMVDYFSVEEIKRYLRCCESNQINAIVARADTFIIRVLAEYWREGGRIQWIAQTAPEQRDAVRNIRQACEWGAAAMFVHGGTVDKLFKAGDIELLERLVSTIQSHGVPAGMAAHTAGNLIAAQTAGWACDFYMVCLYNVRSYDGAQGVEGREVFDDRERGIALGTMKALDKPCLLYKVLAAGRKDLESGLKDVVEVLRPMDAVVVGMFPPDGQDLVRNNTETFCRMTTRDAR